MSNADDPKAWIAKAHEDRQVIDALRDRGPWSMICFHAQQVAEKMLKALLVHGGREPAKTHDLLRLLGDCERAGTALRELEDDCRLLLRFAASSRYPGDPFVPTAADAQHAIVSSERVWRAVMQHLEEKMANRPV